MVLPDRTIGTLLHLGTTAFLIYYLVWVLGTPFVDEDHPFQQLFPPKEYGVVVPAMILGCVFTFLATVGFWCMYNVEMPKEMQITHHHHNDKQVSVAKKQQQQVVG